MKMQFKLLVLFTCMLIGISYCTENSTFDLRRIAASLSSSSKSDISKKLQKEIGRLLAAGKTTSSFETCLKEITKLVTSPTGFPILLGYLDAMGKPGSGIFQGNLFWPGSFSECEGIANSKYCLAGFQLAMYFYGKKGLDQHGVMGTCMPQVCSPEDIRKVLSLMPLNFSYQKIIQVNLTFPNVPAIPPYDGPALCEERDKEYSAGAIAGLTICGILAALCFIGTLMELLIDWTESCSCPSNEELTMKYYDNDQDVIHGEVVDVGTGTNHETHDGEKVVLTSSTTLKVSDGVKKIASWFICFSVVKNTKAILSTDVPSEGILSINGIRFLSMMWVILGHIYSVGVMAGGLVNFTELIKVLDRWSFLAIENAFFCVDSFFLLSGLLVGYLGMKRLENKGQLPIWKFYLHRFIRLTPTYGFVILFYLYVYPLMGKGPLWSTITAKMLKNPCFSKWWTNLIYINNFYPEKLGEECLGWGWYLANDMQFFIISPFILYMAYWYKWVGAIVTNGVLVLASVIVTGALIGHYKLYALQVTADLARPKTEMSFEDVVYTKPYCRIAPYLVGMMLGYILFRKFTFKRRFNKLFMTIGWVVAIILGLTVVYGTWGTSKKGGRPFNDAENIFYGSLSRLTWAVAVSWVIFACHNGFGGLVNKILSWRAFVPLSRLTYGAYLLHPMVMFIFYQTKQSPRAYTDLDMAFQFVSISLISYASAFILALGVEYPILNLDKKLFAR